MKSFDEFCKFENHEIIESHSIYYMSKLKAKLVKTVQRLETEDASTYRTSRLNKSEIFYAKSGHM